MASILNVDQIRNAAGTSSATIKSDGTFYPTGGIVQVQQVVDTTNRTITGTSYATTNIELAITPKSSSSKFLITVTGMIGSASFNFQYLTLNRDTTDLTPSGVNGFIQERPDSTDPANTSRSFSFQFLDSPSTTSQITYKLMAKVNTGTMYLGRRSSDTGIDVPTIMTIMEVAG